MGPLRPGSALGGLKTLRYRRFCVEHFYGSKRSKTVQKGLTITLDTHKEKSYATGQVLVLRPRLATFSSAPGSSSLG